MLLVDTLVVIGMASVSLGTIQEADGVKHHDFWLRNEGSTEVMLKQGYTSCGCTTVEFNKDKIIAPGDSMLVTMRFNPRGKNGEFLETATLVYGENRKRVNLELEGNCITSEETLMKQFPVFISDELRQSTNRFDLGVMRVGEKKTRSVVVLHRNENNRQEVIDISFSVDEKTPKGLQHITYPISLSDNKKKTSVTLDVFVK